MFIRNRDYRTVEEVDERVSEILSSIPSIPERNELKDLLMARREVELESQESLLR